MSSRTVRTPVGRTRRRGRRSKSRGAVKRAAPSATLSPPTGLEAAGSLLLVGGPEAEPHSPPISDYEPAAVRAIRRRSPKTEVLFPGVVLPDLSHCLAEGDLPPSPLALPPPKRTRKLQQLPNVAGRSSTRLALRDKIEHKIRERPAEVAARAGTTPMRKLRSPSPSRRSRGGGRYGSRRGLRSSQQFRGTRSSTDFQNSWVDFQSSVDSLGLSVVSLNFQPKTADAPRRRTNFKQPPA